jgi:cell wall-associated NlpC family hydrolase
MVGSFLGAVLNRSVGKRPLREGKSRGTVKIKVLVGLVLVASLSAAAVSIATQTGAAAPKSVAVKTATSSGAASTHSSPAAQSAATTSSENAIVWYAASQAGIPYCEGGGGTSGPTVGGPASTCAHGVKGYDCMSLAVYSVYQGTGKNVALPENGTQPKGVGTFIAPSSEGTWQGDVATLKPGDAVFFGGSIDNYHHSGIYAGNDEIWDALQAGTPVEEHPFSVIFSDYGNVYDGAYRYASLTHPVLAVSTTSLPGGTIKKAYSATLHATGGNTPYKWSKASGSKALPTGLTLASTGVISGKATKAGTFSFTVKVVSPASSDVAQQTATRTLSIKITS